ADGIVGTLTIDRLDQLHSARNSKPLEIPIPEIIPPTNTCPAPEVEEATLADSIKKGSSTLPTVQAKHLTMEESQEIFSEKINSDEKSDSKVTSSGQFYWTTVIGEKLTKIVEANTTSMLDLLRADFSELFILARENDQKGLKEKMKEIQEKLLKRPGPSSDNLGKLLIPSNTGTTAVTLWSKFDKANKVTKEVDPLVNYPDFARIREEEKSACWSVAEFIINRFKNRGGYTKKDPDKKRSSQNKVQAGLMKSATRNYEWAANLTQGDIVDYGKDLNSILTKIKNALDDGFLIHARVLSGTNFGHGLHPELEDSKKMKDSPKPKSIFGAAEHSLVIIGYEDNTFLFWDPDSSASSLKGDTGFGNLFFQSGRFTTAEIESELFVKDDGDHVNGNKRYQIISVISG
ncbi:MAG TPA: C39 family peptidase, partial [Aequorivita sp.]|nr:C39 family peptidase [Aequorivita sp.]